MNVINIAIVDDDKLMLSLLTDFLSRQSNIKVNFATDSSEKAIDKFKSQNLIPDIIIMDLRLNGMDGIQFAEFLRREYGSIKIIVVTSHYKKSYLGFMLRIGVACFVPKKIDPKELLEIIHSVAEKGFYFKDQQIESIRTQISSKSQKPVLSKVECLSDREIEILKLICEQKTAKEIGAELFITQRTVEGHKNNLFAKSGAKNMAGLVLFAVQNGLINLEEIPVF
ncbi:MAG: response regulator transcription factor [Saprospiraceae bacterium]|nr:response regulator transcription factor [Saprospiraceae bacterium]